jgi:hypothetical protein
MPEGYCQVRDNRPININDYRIEWYHAGFGVKSLLRVTHLPSGRFVQRPAELRGDWKLDDAFAEIEQSLRQAERGKQGAR